MSVCIYLYHNRLIHWTPQTSMSKPVVVRGLSWYAINVLPEIPLDDMVAQGNYSYNLQKGFFERKNGEPLDDVVRTNVIKQIQILGALNTLANTQKMRYTDNSVGQPLTDILLLDEINEYRRTNSLENATILASMAATDPTHLTTEALAMKLWLRYESYRGIIAHLNLLEFNIRQLLAEHRFDEANMMIYAELELIRM